VVNFRPTAHRRLSPGPALCCHASSSSSRLENKRKGVLRSRYIAMLFGSKVRMLFMLEQDSLVADSITPARVLLLQVVSPTVVFQTLVGHNHYVTNDHDHSSTSNNSTRTTKTKRGIALVEAVVAGWQERISPFAAGTIVWVSETLACWEGLCAAGEANP
jgi:hypothetical protein